MPNDVSMKGIIKNIKNLFLGQNYIGIYIREIDL